jgi:anti-sigma factor RsiW
MTPCQFLDDYLADDLTGGDREQFVAHLSGCPSCHAAIGTHERLVALLSAAAELESVPSGLAGRVRGRIRTVRRRRIAATASALAAAVAFVIWLRGRPLELPQSSVEPTAPVAARPAEPVRVTFPGNDVIAVREPMTSPNVTFVWVYPRLGGQSPSMAKRSDQ